jgi:hypothetical protein
VFIHTLAEVLSRYRIKKVLKIKVLRYEESGL